MYDDLKRNAEGYPDPTAYHAMKNMDKDIEVSERDSERFRKLLAAIFAICDAAGFHIEGRVVVRDNRTGKIWR